MAKRTPQNLVAPLVILTGGLAGSGQLWAQPELFVHEERAAISEALSESASEIEDAWAEYALRRSYVRIRMDVLPLVEGEQAEVVFNLFPDVNLTVELTFREIEHHQQRLWKGKVVGERYSSIILVQTLRPFRLDPAGTDPTLVSDFPVVGDIHTQESVYSLRNVGTLPSVLAIEEVDVGSLPGDAIEEIDDPVH